MFSKIQVGLLVFIFSACWIQGANAISMYPSLHRKVEKSTIIAIGAVTKEQSLYRKDAIKLSDDGKSYIVPLPKHEGTVFTIAFKEVLLGDKSFKKISIFQKGRHAEDMAFYKKGATYLLFLKETKIDPKIATEHNLSNQKYYESVSGNQGVFILSSKGKRILTDEEKRNLEYVKTVKTFCEVKKIEDDSQRVRCWRELMQSSNKILRENAKAELEKMGIKIPE